MKYQSFVVLPIIKKPLYLIKKDLIFSDSKTILPPSSDQSKPLPKRKKSASLHLSEKKSSETLLNSRKNELIDRSFFMSDENSFFKPETITPSRLINMKIDISSLEKIEKVIPTKVPALFKHLTKLFDIVHLKVQESLFAQKFNLDDILFIIQKIIRSISVDYAKFDVNIKRKESENLKLAKEIDDAKRETEILSANIENLKSERRKSEIISQAEDPSLRLENIKLERENLELIKRIKSLDSPELNNEREKIVEENLENKKKLSILEDNLHETKKQLELQKNLAQMNKQTIENSEKNLRQWIQSSKELQRQIQSLSRENEKLKNINNRYSECVQMQKEELDSCYEIKSQLNEQIETNTIRINFLHTRLQKEIDEKQRKNLVNESKDFEKEKLILSNIKELLEANNSLSYITNEKNPNKNFQAIDLSKSTRKKAATTFQRVQKRDRDRLHNLSNKIVEEEEDNAMKYKILRAPFFCFVEHRYKFISGEQASNKPELSPVNVILNIRAILDSKYNEYLILNNANNFKELTNFPEFVYSWLGKFEVDESKRKIRKMESSPFFNKIDDIRINFFLDLANEKLNKIWECVTFREFLDEKNNLDEIIFYLHCRNLVFRGSQFDWGDARYCLIHFVMFESVEKVIDLVFSNFEQFYRNILKNKLKEKAKLKKNKYYIDAAFCMRVFLEYYRLDQSKRYTSLLNIFEENFADEKISFEKFRKLLNSNYPFITDIEIAALFRDVWSLGKGNITFNSILTILNEKRIFLANIKLYYNWDYPLKLDNDGSITPFQKVGMICGEILDYASENERKIKKINKDVEKIGVEGFEVPVKRFLKIIGKKFNIPCNEVSKGNIYFDFFDFVFNIGRGVVLKARKWLEIGKIEEIDLVRLNFKVLDCFLQMNETLEEFEDGFKKRKMMLILKIQNSLKVKNNKMMSLLKNIQRELIIEKIRNSKKSKKKKVIMSKPN